MMQHLSDGDMETEETEAKETETLASISTERCNSPEILKSSLAVSQFEDIGKYGLALVQIMT